jgi:hypothetical protein
MQRIIKLSRKYNEFRYKIKENHFIFFNSFTQYDTYFWQYYYLSNSLILIFAC